MLKQRIYIFLTGSTGIFGEVVPEESMWQWDEYKLQKVMMIRTRISQYQQSHFQKKVSKQFPRIIHAMPSVQSGLNIGTATSFVMEYFNSHPKRPAMNMDCLVDAIAFSSYMTCATTSMPLLRARFYYILFRND